MKYVPHWQLLMFVYFLKVAGPVYYVHLAVRKRALAERTFKNLLVYVLAVLGTAVIMHYITMALYFTFFFTVKD